MQTVAGRQLPPGTTAGWAVTVEVLILGLDQKQVRVQHRSCLLSTGQRPDEVALSLAGVAARAGSVSHSTSWRFCAPGRLVLTYAALPGATGVGDLVEHPSVVASHDPLRPQPQELHTHHVVAHAVHHLVELGRRDPTLGVSVEELPELWSALRSLAARTPTADHGRAHQLAAGLGHAGLP